jgi:hypothetical protein
VLSPAPYGWDDIAVAWTPEPGYVGIDTLGLRVSDGHGVQVDCAAASSAGEGQRPLHAPGANDRPPRTVRLRRR